MTEQEIQSTLEATGIPCAYFQFEENTAQPAPFLCWYLPERNDFFADGVNYAAIATLVVELYTDERDSARQAAVEAALTAAELGWRRDETFIGSEALWMTTYTTEVYLHEPEQSKV